MKKISNALKATAFAAFAVLTFTTSASAQILYKIEKPGSDKVSYVLGTHHFAPLSSVDKIEAIPEIISSVDKVYGELDMRQRTEPANMMAMQQKLMAPADSTMAILLTPEQKADVIAVWEKFVGPSNQLEAMLQMVKPAVVSTAMAAAMAGKALPEINPAEGIDMTMQTRALAAGKPVEGLETMDYQIDMLYGRPIAEQLESLLETVKDADEEGEKAILLSEAYTAHDINKLYDLIIKEDEKNPEALERVLFVRNDNWVNILKDEMGDASLFVVVGAGHLPGDRGILDGLKKAGYNVTPVE